MQDVLEWINLEEFWALLVLICLLTFVGQQMSRPTHESYRRARLCAAGAFLCYAVSGIAVWGIPTATDFLVVVIRASLAAGLVHGLAIIVLPLGLIVFGDAKHKVIEPAPRPEPVLPVIDDEPIPEPPTPPAPPLPTVEERAAVALKKYEDRVQLLSQAGLDHLELQAARERIKQQYLRELDAILS